MAKVSLTSLLAENNPAGEPVVQEPAAPSPRPVRARPEAEPAPEAKRGTPSRRSTRTEPQPEPELPRYLQLERKETRLRADQVNDLTVLARRLNRARAGTGERITENTLIRVAVDMLLASGETLSGATEAELRNSVSS